MDSVLKWVVIVWPKIPQNVFGRSDQLAQKFGIFLEKGLIRRPQSVATTIKSSDDYVKTVNKQITMAVPVIFQLCSRIMMCKTCSSEISVFSFFLPSLLLKESKTRILRQMATRFKSFPINIHEIVYWKWQWLL